jgi:hypothetical protein
MEDMYRHQGQLPVRRADNEVKAAYAHFAGQKHRLLELEEENTKLKGNLDLMTSGLKDATVALKRQRCELDSFSKTKVISNVSPATRSDSSIVTGGLHLQSATGS